MSALIGKTLANRYRVDSFLGRGGMAEVYKVWDNQRMVYLAMKVLHQDMAEDKIFLRRFRREAQTLAKLEHPHIVRFHGLEQDGRAAFMLMEYVDGLSLRTMIFDTESSLPLRHIKEIMRAVCGALYYAHHKGMVHCDIKPANIMLDSYGGVRLADFGIARMTDGATATMVGAGTPAYMSPEQIRGENPVPQTDIYALGVVLFEMLTGGERPFIGEQAQITGSTGEKVRWEHLNLQSPNPRKWNPSISSQLEAVVLKSLAKEPARRYPNALEFINALEMAIGETKSVPPLLPATPKPRDPDKRKGKVWGAKKIGLFGLGSVLALSVIFGLFFLISWKPDSPSAPISRATSTLFVTAPLRFTPTSSASLETETPLPALPESIVETLEPTTIPNTPTMPPPTSGDLRRNVLDDANMVYIPAGEFSMGSGSGSPSKEQPQHTVFLDAFWIEQTEVTNAMFNKFVSETGHKTESEIKGQSYTYDRSSWVETVGAYWLKPKGPGSNLSGKDNHPVVHITWSDARAYCQWSGGRLPTEAEWEKAARGLTSSTYPWGNASPSSQYLNYNLNIQDTVAVGSYPQGASPYNIFDLSGNVWEWVSDWYGENYYQISPSSNPQGPSSGNKRVFRGGSWDDLASAVTATVRVGYSPSITSSSIGFRCAKDE